MSKIAVNCGMCDREVLVNPDYYKRKIKYNRRAEFYHAHCAILKAKKRFIIYDKLIERNG